MCERKAEAGQQPTSSFQMIWPAGHDAPLSSYRDNTTECVIYSEIQQQKYSFFCVRGQEGEESGAHLCRALAVQYLRFLSGSFTCPSLQHWPHTNFILRLRGRPRPAAAPNPPTPTPPMGATPTPRPSPPIPPILVPITPMPPAAMLFGWGMWMGWRTEREKLSFKKICENRKHWSQANIQTSVTFLHLQHVKTGRWH